MNVTQMHERLRLELLRRIQRGTLSLSLLSRQTGFGASHLSNFLHGKRRLSIDAIDRILTAQHMTAHDLLPVPGRVWSEPERAGEVPVVSHATAMHEPLVRPGAVQRFLHLPAALFQDTRARCGPARKAWARFVAVEMAEGDAAPMQPVLLPHALVVLDRHYNSLAQYRPHRANLYAVRHESRLVVRYADFQASRLVLRPHRREAPVHLVELTGEESPGDLIAGRVIAILNLA